MKNILTLIVLIIWSASTIGAQEKDSSDYKNPSNFIWETVIGNSTFYICGSVHVGKEEHLPIDKPYLDCLAKSHKVILEIPDDFGSMPSKIFEFAEAGKLSEEKYFRKNLEPEVIEKIIDMLGEEAFHNLDKYNSGLLVSNIAIQKMKAFGYDQKFGIDRYVREIAIKQNKEVLGLDDLRFQFDLIQSDLPYEGQLKVIAATVNSAAKIGLYESEMYEAYFNNDVARFRQIFLSRFDFENPQVKALYERMFASRNRSWAEKIEKIGKENNLVFFVMVGSGHLFGPDNLLELLKRKGYKVSFIN